MGRYTDGTTQKQPTNEQQQQNEAGKKKKKQGVPKEKVDSVAAIIAQNPDLPNWLKVNTPNLDTLNNNSNDNTESKKDKKKNKKKAVNEVNHSFTPSDNPFGLAETSTFTILFPQYREPYLKQVWPLVKAALGHSPFFIDAELDLKSGRMTVSTNAKTFDPFIIIKARDVCSLMSRGISFEQAKRVLDDGIFSDIIKIGNLVKDTERFKRRRQRILGPDGATLKALELLTGCYIFIQGKTVSVIGDVKGIKQVRAVVEDCMTNIHPVYHIKELMIRRELEKKPELANEDWSKYLPQFKKNVKPKRKQQKKTEIKKKKPYTPFPNPIEKSKVDLQLESGEYFLNETQKKEKKMKAVQEKQKEKTQERLQERAQMFVAPEDKEKKKNKKEKQTPVPASSSGESVSDLAQRVKEKHDSMQNKRKASDISQGKGFSSQDFVQQKKKRKY